MRNTGWIVALGLGLAAVFSAYWFDGLPANPDTPRATGTGPEDTANGAADYELRFRRCDFQSHWRREVRCADLLTPVYRSREGDQRFRLPVVILRSNASQRRDDPVIYLPGGPGGSAGLDRDGVEFWQSWQDYSHLQRDLILMDRRGVGQSRPALTCPEYDAYSERIVSQRIAPEREAREAAELLQTCFARLEAAGHFHPDQFGTRQSAADLVALMRLLPYEQFNLIGVSYGTRLALAAAAPDDEGVPPVRTLVLDSLYPPDQGGLISWPGVVTESIERFIRWCEGREGCAESVPDLEALLMRALATLKETPLELSVESWYRTERIDVVLDDNRLLTTVFSAMYHRNDWPMIAEALQGVVNAQPERVAPLVESFINQALDGSLSSLTYMAVDCFDHTLGTEAAYNAELARYPRYAAYMDRWDSYVCRWLGSADQPLPPLEPPAAPTLILAGELDPVTPAQWARDVARRWPDAQLHIADDVGHSVIWSDTCAEAALGRFLDHPERDWVPECIAENEKEE